MLELVKEANSVLWGPVLLLLLCGTGIWYTFRLKFIQVRKFGEGCKLVFGHMKFNGEKGKHGEMTPFQSLTTAIAAQVGTGNLTGAATALISGGPGAIFWMWISAFFGMATIYAEATLAQTFKTTTPDGEVTGGPVYYIRQAFKGTFGKILAGAIWCSPTPSAALLPKCSLPAALRCRRSSSAFCWLCLQHSSLSAAPSVWLLSLKRSCPSWQRSMSSAVWS